MLGEAPRLAYSRPREQTIVPFHGVVNAAETPAFQFRHRWWPWDRLRLSACTDLHEFPKYVKVELYQMLRFQLCYHPCQGQIGKFLIGIATTSHVTMDSSEPALLELFWGIGGRSPDSGGKGPTMFIKSQGLECVFDVRLNICIDKRVLFRARLRNEPDLRHTKRSVFCESSSLCTAGNQHTQLCPIRHKL